jgi:2-amino-4-hydroxy-6-hydroxymethyldihydropteridine diphosphokinase
VTRCFIALGSNLDDPESQLRRAVQELRSLPQTQIYCISPLYQNPAVGPGEQPDYLNAVVALDTKLAPQELLHALQTIETNQGRRREIRWGARSLDLDILLYGATQLNEPDLQIPHPRMLLRNFVLYPLFDLAPDLQLPDGSSLSSHLDSCSNRGLSRLAIQIQE